MIWMSSSSWTQKGNTSDPKTCRGFTLINISNKIYGSIMCGWQLKIISKHDVKCQFGPTTGVGWQDWLFTIKTLLHLRHKHNIPTLVEFADLNKAFNTPNHELLVSIMGKYDTHPWLCSEIKRMYDKSVVKIITGKIFTCQTRRNHGSGTIYVTNDVILRDTRRWVDVPGINPSPICMQVKLTKINQTISDPLTRQLITWHSLQSILHALCRWRHICFESRTNI